MDFPRVVGSETAPEPDLLDALGGPRPVASFRIERPEAPSYFMLVYETAGEIALLEPDFSRLKSNVIVTADARAYDEQFDFVSRYFAPASGILEDPVTGSAHCSLVPYWAERLDKRELVARQISSRGGTVYCTDTGDRVLLGGYCVEYLVGSIQLPDRCS
jgi:predicted PhzF superfamily epimerase YddE/YHI9